MLGVIADRLAKSGMRLYTLRRTRIVTSRRLERRHSPSETQRLLAAHAKAGSALVPYVLNVAGAEMVLPFVHDPAWLRSSPLSPDSDEWAALVDEPDRFAVFPHDRLPVAPGGVRMFDGQICYVRHAPTSETPNATWRLGVCSWAAYANFLQDLGGLDGVKRRRSSRRSRDDFHDPVATVRAGRRPVAAGLTVVLAERADDNWRVLVQRRSKEVHIDAGLLSFIPLSGLEPNTVGNRSSSLGLIPYNLLREMAEELFDVPELVHAASAPSFDPDWIRRFAPIEAVETAWRSGQVTVESLGCGFHLRTVGANFIVVAAHRAPGGWSTLLKDAAGNWEVGASGPANPSLRFEELGGERLATEIANREFTDVSTVAYGLVKEWAAIH